MAEREPKGPAPALKDAATLVVVREGSHGGGGVEVFCVERKKGGFLGGAVVFPGGKLEPDDLDPSWLDRSTPPRFASESFAADAALLRGLAVAACRETLEEAALLPVDGAALTHADLVAWRTRVASKGASLWSLLEERGLKLDLDALHPLARWITPTSEPHRFDTRFYLWAGGGGTSGQHDGLEVTASFWATPAELLARFDAGTIQLAPPTHRVLAVLCSVARVPDAVAVAARSCLEPICPKLVAHRDATGESFAIVLPGDPDHDVRESRSPGPSRFVLRGGRFVPEEPPA
jgi:8-oxo-dGTP pyrophosphatase MutT (NUDIX family)